MKYTQHFDTVKMRLPLSTINTIQADKYEIRETKGGIQFLQLHSKHLKGIHGLNLIRINEVTGEAILELTAKILGRDYPNLLTAETIPVAFDKVNATGFLSFDTGAAMAAAEPLLLHPAKDIQLLRSVPAYTRLWGMLHVSDKYLVKGFRNEYSLTFEKNVSTPKAQEYAKLYDKAHELELSQNKEFRESLAPADLNSIRSHFHNTARFEIELKSVTKIRQFYSLHPQQPVKLSTVLESDRNPLSIMYDRLTAHMTTQPEATDINLFMEELNEKETGIFGVSLSYSFDLDRIKRKYMQLYAKRPATGREKFNKAKELVSRFRAQQSNLRNSDFQLMDELQLKIAA